MYGSKRVAVRELNPHILCALCGGYLIQATTVIECLHSFCRTCIVNFLETSKVCPICDAQIHKTRPLLNIRPDQTLQSLVYKLVPGLFQDEMRRRREFHATLSESDVEDLSLEERGEASLEKEFKPGDDHISLVLQLAFRENKTKPFEICDRRYLLCPSEVTVKHLKKFIRMKFQLNDSHKIEMYRAREELSDDLMLQDIALIYSWRRERPMNICYIVSESRRVKFGGWPKQAPLLTKQEDLSCTVQESTASNSKQAPLLTKQQDLSCTVQESTASKSKQAPLLTKQQDLSCTVQQSSATKSSEPDPKYPTVSAHPEIAVPRAAGTPAGPLAPVSKCNASDSTPSSVTPLSAAIPATTLSSSIISAASNPITITESLPSMRSGLGKIVSKDTKQLSSADTSVINNIKALKRQAIISATSEPKVTACTNMTTTSKSKCAAVKHDASKLMHSVESILKKTPKRANHKTNTSTLSWSPVSEVQPPSSGNLCKEKTDKTTNKTTKQIQREQQFNETLQHETSQHARDSVVGKSPECGGQVVAGIKRSQSVIEPASSVTDVCRQSLKPQEAVGNDHPSTLDGLPQAEKPVDIYSSYIPKLQKHLKMCAVKRSASYEGPSLTPVLGAINCVDAMEKRNWKKRKLSTLDFDVSEITVVSATTINGRDLTSTSNGDSRNSCQQEGTLPQDRGTNQKLLVLEDSSPSNNHPSVHPKSSVDKSLTSPPKDHSIAPSISYLPFLSPQGGTTTSSSGKPQSKHSTSDPKVKPSSRKTNVAPTGISSSTKNNNKVSCGNRYNDLDKFNHKIDQIKIVSSKKQPRVLSSDSVTTSACVSHKSPGYVHNKCNNKTISTLVEVSANGSSSVEEICVDISSSPSDVSNTSPTTNVTSPGTEDRTDGSALPDIHTSCDTNCVVTFSGKVVPLDLSVKKKK